MELEMLSSDFELSFLFSLYAFIVGEKYCSFS